MTKTYLVTGAASGIGLELTRRLLTQGHRVWACDIQADALDALRKENSAAGDRLHTARLDVRDAKAWAAEVQALVDAWGRLDVLCNVAGVLKENWCEASTPQEVDFHFDINVKGVIFGMQAALPFMKRHGGGHIVNIASLAGLSPVPGLALYSASKFAVRAYSIAAAMELKQYNITVSAICPDAVQTPMLDIQLGKEETALTFSGTRALTTSEVVDAIVESETSGALEVMLPLTRGIISKTANLAPGITARAIGLFRKAGLRRQQKIAKGQTSTVA